MANGPGLHSRVVAVLKLGLPLVAVGLLAALFLSQTDDSLGGGVVFSRGDIEALGEGLRITDPTFTGTTSGEDRFRFTAREVVPDAAPPTRAAITGLSGSLELKGGPVVSLEAQVGDLDVATQRLDMTGTVRIESSDGYRMLAEKATLNVRDGTLVAGDSVETVGPLGNITSGSLLVAPAAETGDVRRFSFAGGVRLIYDPPDNNGE